MTTEKEKTKMGVFVEVPQGTPVLGDQFKFPETGNRWWTVQAVAPGFVAMVQQVPFEEKGTLRYTVLDLDRGIRGPCNLIGQGYGDGSYSRAECEEMLAQFVEGSLEVSHRNNVPTRITASRRAK